MNTWKDYFGVPLEVGDEVIYVGRYKDLRDGTVDEVFGNCIVIKDCITGLRSDFGWGYKGMPIIKKTSITVNIKQD